MKAETYQAVDTTIRTPEHNASSVTGDAHVNKHSMCVIYDTRFMGKIKDYANGVCVHLL